MELPCHTTIVPTIIAAPVLTGKYESKMGQLGIIEHETAESLTGGMYEDVIGVYAAIPGRRYFAENEGFLKEPFVNFRYNRHLVRFLGFRCLELRGVEWNREMYVRARIYPRTV